MIIALHSLVELGLPVQGHRDVDSNAVGTYTPLAPLYVPHYAACSLYVPVGSARQCLIPV